MADVGLRPLIKMSVQGGFRPMILSGLKKSDFFSKRVLTEFGLFGPAVNLIVRSLGVGLPGLSRLNLTLDTPALMGLTGLFLLAFCLMSCVVATLHCSARVAVRCTGSGRQVCCRQELIKLRMEFGSVPSSTGPPRWLWPVRRVSRIAPNHALRLRPFFQTALPWQLFRPPFITINGE